MKKLSIQWCTRLMFGVILSCCLGLGTMAQSPDQPSITYQTFYDGLSPYGTWIDYPGYGNVWQPTIDGDFRPYLTNGYWDYSNDGWMWMSNFSWGWGPFHYGRWIYDDFYGWLWIPGYEWSPSWVTWGMVDNYYAWAPLMPDVNVGIQFGFWSPPAIYWNFCPFGHIYDRDIYNQVVPRASVGNFVSRISIINNFGTTRIHNQYYSRGPQINDVERYTDRNIRPVTIRDVNNISAINRSGNQISVYRPTVQHTQPRVFRRIDNNNVHPIRSNSDNVSSPTEMHRQVQNVNRLPIFRAPQNSFGN